MIEPNLTINMKGELLRNLRSGLIFKLNANDERGYKLIELINVEMELKYPVNFLERLFEFKMTTINFFELSLEAKEP